MNRLTFDTETMNITERFIFDVGFVIHNDNGEILYKNHYLIKEIFENRELMENAFYAKNIPIYLEMLEKGKITKKSFPEILKILQNIVEEYEVEKISAYNLLFDLHAFIDTFNYVYYGKRKPKDENGEYIKPKKSENNKPFFDFCKKFANEEIFGKELQYQCLYGMTVTKLLANEDYVKVAIANDWFTEKGNVLTNAECAYRYTTGQYNFIESHTALDDAMIEVELYNKCQESPIEYDEEIIYLPYRLVKKVYEMMN